MYNTMRLNQPKKMTFLIALLLGLAGLVGMITPLPVVTAYAFWFVFGGFLLLVAGCMAKGL